jgi:dGTPase
VRQDLCSFEGNAQGIRLVHTLMRMNLTWAQVGCILKYTRPAWWSEATPASHSYLMKKAWLLFSRRRVCRAPA